MPSPVQVKKAVKAILSDPKYKQRAEAIQVDIVSYDAPTRAAELIEQLAASRQQT
jgi:UDP:flavonoid glycosyltransferase YjiC (YdhE family)